MIQQLLHHLTGRVLFEAEIEADADTPKGVQLGLAVKVALKAGAYLGRAYLRGADLRGADLRGAYLGRADLGRADLRGAYLGGADLGGADLRGADLDGADLRGAYLGGADLGGADLRGAYLGRADLRGAYLRGADLRGVIWGDGAKWREGVLVTRPPIYLAGLPYEVWILDRHAQIGCKVSTLDEWSAMGEDEIEYLDGGAALAFWRLWRDPLLAVAAAAGRPLAVPAGREAA